MRASSTVLCLSLWAAATSLACGKVKTFPDGGGSGADAPATPDGPPGPDANPRGTVHVTVIDSSGSGAPVVNTPVVFIDPDGTVVADVKTDGNGRAQADVLPGANVTAVWTVSATNYQMATLFGIKPGDDATLGLVDSDQTSAGQFTVNNIPGYSGATSYTVYGPCGSAPEAAGAPVAVLDLENYCKDLSDEILVVASDANNNPLASISKTGLTLTGGGSTSLSGLAYTTFRQFSASYTNIPATVGELDLTRETSVNNGYSTYNNHPMPGTATTLTMQVPVSGTAFIDSQFQDAMGSGHQEIRQKIAGNSLSYGLDVGGTLLPWFHSASFDVATATLTWTGTPGTGGDFFLGEAVYTRGQTQFAWIFVAPPGVPNVHLPTLPADAGDVNPMAGDVPGLALAALIDTDAIPDYDAVRDMVYPALNNLISNTTTANLRVSSVVAQQ